MRQKGTTRRFAVASWNMARASWADGSGMSTVEFLFVVGLLAFLTFLPIEVYGVLNRQMILARVAHHAMAKAEPEGKISSELVGEIKTILSGYGFDPAKVEVNPVYAGATPLNTDVQFRSDLVLQIDYPVGNALSALQLVGLEPASLTLRARVVGMAQNPAIR